MKSILGRLKKKTPGIIYDTNDINETNNYRIGNAERRIENKIENVGQNYDSNKSLLNKPNNEMINLNIPLTNIIDKNNENKNQIVNLAVENPQIPAENNNSIPNIKNENNTNVVNISTNQKQEKLENKIQTEFKNIFQGKDLFSNNKHRKRLIYMTLASIIIDALILQLLW
jgi:hypothetical protein